MKYKAFTLVELIVVITLLGILSTVAFVSYIGYSENSRDSARISNLTKLEKSLEARKAKAGEYPTPDDPIDVTYLGKKIFTQGILGDKTKKQLKFKAEGMDPKYEADYTYSVTADGKRYEMGTIMEDGANNTLGFFANTYASEDDVALNHGNFNGKYYSTKVNGETHVFTLPSLTLKNKANFEVTVGQTTNNFAVTGVGALPETYSGKSEANSSVDFTPRLLYRGPNCGLETDQEIVNFVATLRDSFNREPFISDPTYASVFSDYDYLRNNIDDFDNLEELGIKINESLGCHIKNFKTVDIFPTQCGYEGLNFEGVEEGFDIESESCLFKYNGSGFATVRDNIGISSSKGLIIDPVGGIGSKGEFSYRVFSYTPMKFNFDYLPNFTSNSNFRFYINDVEYKFMNRSSDDYDNGIFQTFATPLLKPGLNDFKWLINNGHGDAKIILDNLDFTCVGGGNGCGWTDYDFEVGDINPWEIFDFSGGIESTWTQVDRGNGTLAIKSPELGTNPESFITKTITLNQPAKIAFDMMTDLGGNGSVKFFIDDVQFLRLWGDGGKFEDKYETYSTPILPEGTYKLKWRIDRYTWYESMLWLDQLRIICLGGAELSGNEGCGWEKDTYENGNINPWEVFKFTGSLDSYHWKQVERSPGNMAITNMEIHGDGKTSIIKTITLNEPAKINFDMMTDISGNGSVRFYLDDNRMLNLRKNGGIYEDKYERYTSELLPQGTYTLRWDLDRYTWYKAFMWLDNFHLSCEGGGGICGWSENTFEPGSGNPFEEFTITGDLESYEWFLEERENGGHALTHMILPKNGRVFLEKTIEFPGDTSLSFDLKTDFTHGSFVKLFVNGVEEFVTISNGTIYDGEFQKVTLPSKPAGIYNFRWEIYKFNKANSQIWLDNLTY